MRSNINMMNPPNQSEFPFASSLINNMATIIRKAGRRLLKDFNEIEKLQSSLKGPGNFVTQSDKNIESFLIEELSKIRPNYSILSEEVGEVIKSDPDQRWIIDPIDGTFNFLHGLPHWCISIALEANNKLIAGMIFDPAKDELFWAEKGYGAYLNQQRIRVATRNQLSNCLMGVSYGSRRHLPQNEDCFELLVKSTASSRKMGSAALDLCYVACGRLDLVWDTQLQPWDIAAGILIVREAGGLVTEAFGGPNILKTGDICATNNYLHPQVLKIVKNIK